MGTRAPRRNPLTRYRDDPVGYARDVLGVVPWGKQVEIALACQKPPYRVAVQSGHNTGKSFAGGWLINWWYDTRDPGAVITTAPTATHVRDVLWREVRLQRGSRAGFIGPSAPELRSAPDHYAKGFTTGKSEAFHGRHDSEMLFLIDESVGVDAIFAEVIRSMFKPELGHAWVMFFNPTDTTSWVYQEVRSGNWNVVRMSSLDHPNVTAQLAGRPAPIPSAVSLSQIEAGIDEDCDPLHPDDPRQPGDFEWRPGSGKWFRPGPVFQSRWLGLWPSQGTYGVWSEALWGIVSALAPEPEHQKCPEVGCDVARYGDDATVLHARIGPVSVHHERHNGWGVDQTAGRLKELCRELGKRYDYLPERIPVKVDDDGVGGGVVDLRGEYQFVGVNAASVPRRPGDYPNKRSELWFQAVEKARKGLVALGHLPRADRTRLETQLLAPTWRLDGAGRRQVEPKADTKKRLGFSPDDADSFNLAYYESPMSTIAMHEPPPAAGRGGGRGFGNRR